MTHKLNSPDHHGSSSPATNILIIDDEVEILDETWSALNKFGLQCVCATTAQQGLDALLKMDSPSIVLCDVKMPGTSGLEFIAQAKKKFSPSGILKFAVITGHPSLETAISCFKLGVSDFISKPVRRSRLIEVVGELQADIDTSLSRRNDSENGQGALKNVWQDIDSLTSNLRLLEAHSKESDGHGPTADAQKLGATEEGLSADRIESILKARAARNLYFDSQLFSDPTWDMLLDLMLARLRGHKIPVSTLCISSGVPLATAHRRMIALLKLGLIRRASDQDDARRVLVELTEDGEARMRNYFERTLGFLWPI